MAESAPSPEDLSISPQDQQINPPDFLKDLTVQSKQDIRKYTKSTPKGQETRSDTAQQILEARRTERSAKLVEKSTKEQVNQIMTMIAGKEITRARARELLDQMEAREAVSIAYLIEDVWSDQDLSRQSQQVAKLESEVEDSTQKMEQLRQRLASIDADRQVFKRADQILGEFYQQKELEKQQTSVEHIAEQYGVYFVHAIKAEGLKNIAFKNGETDWKDKLATVLSKAPPVCSSSLEVGQSTLLNAYGDMGVVISGGQITEAFSHDQSTILGENLERRSTASPSIYERPRTPITDRIKRAIEDHPQRMGTRGRFGPYNEIIIDNPQIAGFYLTLKSSSRAEQAPLADIVPVLMALKLPLYVKEWAKRPGTRAIIDYPFQQYEYGLDEQGEPWIRPLSPDNYQPINPQEMTRKVYQPDQALKKEIDEKAGGVLRTPAELEEIRKQQTKQQAA